MSKSNFTANILLSSNYSIKYEQGSPITPRSYAEHVNNIIHLYKINEYNRLYSVRKKLIKFQKNMKQHQYRLLLIKRIVFLNNLL